MKWIYYTFRSVTYAQKGQRALEGEGLRCSLLRTPGWMEQKGCSYALRLESSLGDIVEEILKSREIAWTGRYLCDSGGRVRQL